MKDRMIGKWRCLNCESYNCGSDYLRKCGKIPRLGKESEFGKT